MSVEATLYTKTATKIGLTKFLLANNFQKSRHFLEEMNTEEMLHFMWFGFDNYESSTGVEATVLKPTIEDKKNIIALTGFFTQGLEAAEPSRINRGKMTLLE